VLAGFALIPERFALILAAQTLGLAALGGGASGLLIGFIVHLRWSWARLFVDMLGAVLTTLILALALTVYDLRHHTSHNQVWILISVGGAAPALVHLFVSLLHNRAQ
jgi:hypothetical protein